MQRTYFLLMILTIIGLSHPMIVIADEANVATLDLQANEITAKNMETRHVHVRSLAASCAACHGTNSSSSGNIANLSGMYSKDFILQMLAFKSGERTATVMHHHAKGLNSEEITDLAEYFSAQVSKTSVVLHPQKLSVQSLN